ncbi:hypothetical protein G6F44_013130 [Rhizopus delemar]|nr:hypothetical protein G6F44_013130 [Rhizopus delemar]
MKQGSPLKGVVSINGKSMVAIFDTGASVSVIGKALAASLGLRPNGDTLALTGLENKQGDGSPIVSDVPICIAGKIRPEHMCIHDLGNTDLFLLGITWFQAYGIELDLINSVVKIPTTTGMVKLQGYTSHIKDRSLLNSNVMLPSVLDAGASSKATVGSYDDRRVCMVQTSQNHVDAYEDVLIPDGEALEEEFKYNADNITIGVLNIIKPSNGLWASPCFFIPKKDGSLRLVIDYRKLNKMVKQDAYPLPHIDELLDSVGGATIFSTLDCTSGYHQLPLNEEHAERTGFVTKRGTFSFNVLPFGITTGCSLF